MRSQPILTAAAILLVALAAPAFGVPLAPALDEADPACERVDMPAMGPGCRRSDGHFEVHLADGTFLVTHGPDPAPDHGPSLGPGDPERAPACATDHYQHVLYGRPTTSEDRYEEVKPQIQSAIRRMNAILNEEALESGGVTADYKVLCDGVGEVRVDAFAVQGATSYANIVNAAKAAGFSNSNADYSIFYDGGERGICGWGSFWNDVRLAESNRNNNGGGYAITYVGCWNGRTPMHENGHNQGAVQRLAPMSDLTGHCLEGYDVMCYPTSYVLRLCMDRMHFDCRHDTYFDAQPEPGEWLSTHWNLGSRLNRFIEFGG